MLSSNTTIKIFEILNCILFGMSRFFITGLKIYQKNDAQRPKGLITTIAPISVTILLYKLSIRSKYIPCIYFILNIKQFSCHAVADNNI